MGYYDSKKHCEKCDKEVYFLESIAEDGMCLSFCVECGGLVRLLSPKEWDDFMARVDQTQNIKRRRKDG